MPSLQLLDNSVLAENRVQQFLCDVLTGEQTSAACHQPILTLKPQCMNCSSHFQAKDPKEVRRQTNCWQYPRHRNHRHLRLPKLTCLFNCSACFRQHPVDPAVQHCERLATSLTIQCTLSAWVGPEPNFRLAFKWAAS